jgi:hypothetical protein
VRQYPDLIHGEIATRECLRSSGLQRLNHEPFCQILQRASLSDGVRTYPGTAQGSQVTAGAKSGAQVAGEGPDIGAACAADRRVNVEQVAVGTQRGDGELVDRDGAGGQIRSRSGAGQLVRTLAVHLNRADLRRDLKDFSGQ